MAGIGANDGWEYIILPEREVDSDRLSTLGKQCWELVTHGDRPEGSVLYFKRRLPPFREMVTLDQRRAYCASLGLQPETAKRPNR